MVQMVHEGGVCKYNSRHQAQLPLGNDSVIFGGTTFQDDELAARPILLLLPIYLFTSQTYQNFHSHEMRIRNKSLFIDSAFWGTICDVS